MPNPMSHLSPPSENENIPRNRRYEEAHDPCHLTIDDVRIA